MSGGEEVKEVKTVEMTEHQKAKLIKDARKRQADELAAYKKRLRDGNDLKEQQVKELDLNIQYFEKKKRWLEIQPELEELEAKEQAIMLEARKREEAAAKAAEAESKPDIVIPKQGKPRAKKVEK